MSRMWAISGNGGTVYVMARYMWANCGLVHLAQITLNFNWPIYVLGLFGPD